MSLLVNCHSQIPSVIPEPNYVIPAPNYAIPAQAGIHILIDLFCS